MAEDILKDNEYYDKLQNDSIKTDRIHYHRLLRKHQHYLREKEYKYLSGFEVKHRQFYGLPKVHKSDEIKEKCEHALHSTVNIGKIENLNGTLSFSPTILKSPHQLTTNKILLREILSITQ